MALQDKIKDEELNESRELPFEKVGLNIVKVITYSPRRLVSYIHLCPPELLSCAYYDLINGTTKTRSTKP